MVGRALGTRPPDPLALSLGASEAGKDTLGHHDPFEFYNTNSRVGSVAPRFENGNWVRPPAQEQRPEVLG